MVHDNIQLKCIFCPFTTVEASNLMVHQRQHFGVRAYQCEICDLVYTTQGVLNYHFKTTHSGIKTKCFKRRGLIDFWRLKFWPIFSLLSFFTIKKANPTKSVILNQISIVYMFIYLGSMESKAIDGTTKVHNLSRCEKFTEIKSKKYFQLQNEQYTDRIVRKKWLRRSGTKTWKVKFNTSSW